MRLSVRIAKFVSSKTSLFSVNLIKSRLLDERTKQMKLKDGMVLGHVDGEDFAIATGKAMKHFNGVIHNNPTAAFLFELLQTEQTEDSLVAALTEKYDVDADTARADVREMLDTLRAAGVLD